jgi:hypothetical protein
MEHSKAIQNILQILDESREGIIDVCTILTHTVSNKIKELTKENTELKQKLKLQEEANISTLLAKHWNKLEPSDIIIEPEFSFEYHSYWELDDRIKFTNMLNHSHLVKKLCKRECSKDIIITNKLHNSKYEMPEHYKHFNFRLNENTYHAYVKYKNFSNHLHICSITMTI